MATTKTDICNIAMSLIGEERMQLADVDVSPSTHISRQCLLHYDITLAEVTRKHTWNCSKKRDELTTSDYTEHGWDKQATIPTDSIRLIGLTNTDSFYRFLVPHIDWAVEGTLILSNSEDNFLLYQKIPTIAEMDDLFLQCFYTSLAVKLAIPLKGKGREIRRELMQELEQIIMPEARRVNGFEGFEAPIIDSEWLEATITPTTGGTTTWMALSVGDIPM